MDTKARSYTSLPLTPTYLESPVTSFQPSKAGCDHPQLLERSHLLCCFSSLSFDVPLPATCYLLQDFLELAPNYYLHDFPLEG